MKDFLTYRKNKATEEQLQEIANALDEQQYHWKRTTATGGIFKIFTISSHNEQI